MGRDILIIVDMQNDFCKPGGALYNEEAEKIIPNVKELTNKFPYSNIFLTADFHFKSEPEYQTIEDVTLPPHCIRGTTGQSIVTELDTITYNTTVLNKRTFSALDLQSKLEPKSELKSITLCGVCTDICVISNALMLRSIFPKIPIYVKADCCAGTSKEAHEAALTIMKNCLINII